MAQGERTPSLTKDAVPSIFKPSASAQRVECEAEAVKKRKGEPNKSATQSRPSKFGNRGGRKPLTKTLKCCKQLNRGPQVSLSKYGKSEATREAAARRNKPIESAHNAPKNSTSSEWKSPDNTGAQSTLAKPLRCYGRPNRDLQRPRSTVDCSETEVAKEARTRLEEPNDTTRNRLQKTVSSEYESSDSAVAESNLEKSSMCYGWPNLDQQSLGGTVECGVNEVKKEAPTRHEKPTDTTKKTLQKNLSSECGLQDSTVAQSTLAKSLRCYGRLGRSQQGIQSTVERGNTLVIQNNLSKTVRCCEQLNHGVRSLQSTLESDNSEVATKAAVECKGPHDIAENLPQESVSGVYKSAGNTGIHCKEPHDAKNGLLGEMTVCEHMVPENMKESEKSYNEVYNLPPDANCPDISLHLSSTHDPNNRVDCGGMLTSPQCVTVEPKLTNCNTVAGTLLGSFDDLFSIAKQLNLPSSSWAVHCIDVNGVRDIVFSELVVRHEPLVTAVHSPKTMHVNSDMSVSILLLGKPIESISGISTEFSSVADLEELLRALDAICICKGGPTIKMYPEVEPECAYIDFFEHWRHVKCPIALTNKGSNCKWCRNLYETLRVNMSRTIARQRAGASLKRIRIPLTGASNKIELLRQTTESLKESNVTLRTQLLALRAELAGVKKGFRLGQAEVFGEQFDMQEITLPEEVQGKEGDVATEEDDKGMHVEEEKDVTCEEQDKDIGIEEEEEYVAFDEDKDMGIEEEEKDVDFERIYIVYRSVDQCH